MSRADRHTPPLRRLLPATREGKLSTTRQLQPVTRYGAHLGLRFLATICLGPRCLEPAQRSLGTKPPAPRQVAVQAPEAWPQALLTKVCCGTAGVPREAAGGPCSSQPSQTSAAGPCSPGVEDCVAGITSSSSLSEEELAAVLLEARGFLGALAAWACAGVAAGPAGLRLGSTKIRGGLITLKKKNKTHPPK